MMAQVSPIVAQLERRLSTLQSQRSNWEQHWQQLADYMLPRKADITKKRAKGDKRTELIFDGTAIHAVELLASSLHGMLTSPSTPWFSMRHRLDSRWPIRRHKLKDLEQFYFSCRN